MHPVLSRRSGPTAPGARHRGPGVHSSHAYGTVDRRGMAAGFEGRPDLGRSTRRLMNRWPRSRTARRATPSPPAMPPRPHNGLGGNRAGERSEVLRNCWKILIDHTDELAELIVAEHGKPLADAKGEIAYSAEFFRWNAEETVRIHGELGSAPSGANRIIVHHPPVGVVAMITPWNFPAAMITRKLAPALGAGNGIVVKPPRDSVDTAADRRLLQEAGVPEGLVNVVPTTTSGEWLDAVVDHRAVRMLSFTGSTEVGRMLLKRAADRVLKTRDGARRERTVHRLRRRRHRCRRRRGDDRQDAALGRDVHCRQPLLRRGRRARRVQPRSSRRRWAMSRSVTASTKGSRADR